jgi:hypothetical protein
MALALGTAAGPASAVEIDTGVPDVKLRWDNTFKYSGALRARDRHDALVADINQDDGDRNFGKGLISNRVDWLSEVDANWQNLGARISAAAWYDTVYNRRNDNDSAGAFGPGTSTVNTTGAFDEFLPSTRKLHGRKAEVLDAFVSARFTPGDMALTTRLGRHAMFWGESLFLGSNAIAGGQQPVDVIKLVSVPGTEFKDGLLPVPQVSAEFSPASDVTVAAYYQFRYRANRLPAPGSYFSVLDSFPPPNLTLLGPVGVPVSELEAKDSGQGGVSVRMTLGQTDVGLYALQFHDKAPQYYPVLGLVPGPAPGVFVPAPVGFRIAYHENTRAVGASASHTFGDVNAAVEASIRTNAALASTASADASGLAPPGVLAANDNADNTAYAVGRTAHVNLNMIWTVPRTPLWNEASMAAEIAWNRMLSCTRQCTALDPHATRDAARLAVRLAPIYNQVLPGLNVSVPITLNYTPKGSRSTALGQAWAVSSGGDLSLGLQGTYLETWRFGLNVTHFFGPAGLAVEPIPGSPVPGANRFSYKQSLRDRDFVSFAASRTF